MSQIEATAKAGIHFTDGSFVEYDIIGHQVSENWVQIITNNFVTHCMKAENLQEVVITQLENSPMVQDVLSQQGPEMVSQ